MIAVRVKMDGPSTTAFGGVLLISLIGHRVKNAEFGEHSKSSGAEVLEVDRELTPCSQVSLK